MRGSDVLVVDDGSVDHTAEVAHAVGATVVSLPFNLGVGGAMRTGFKYAQRHGYDRAVQIDADGQHDPAEIPRLLEALDSGADLVVGTRFGQDSTRYDTGRFRRSAMRGLQLGVRLLSGRRFSDTSSGFRGYSQRMIEFFARDYPVEYLGDSVEAILIAGYGGFEVTEVGVSMRPRAGGLASTRNFKLLYHFVRLVVVMISTARFRRRKAAT
jgi:glycosyltransferase involved in cell wall biosynthesis